MVNCLTTHQDRLDFADAKALGIGLSEYKDAKCKIAASSRIISREEILSTVRGMKVLKRVNRG